jgi:hypothetical protein
LIGHMGVSTADERGGARGCHKLYPFSSRVKWVHPFLIASVTKDFDARGKMRGAPRAREPEIWSVVWTAPQAAGWRKAGVAR